MSRSELLAFLRRHRLAVEASVGPRGQPQAAVVGYGISDALELVFDTVDTTRKVHNLRADPRIALVVGWDEVTAQIEGLVDFPKGDELKRMQECYFAAYPDGRERLKWPGILHLRVRPKWIRYSHFTTEPETIVEFGEEDLA